MTEIICNDGLEVERWSEMVPVLFRETRRLIVCIDFQSIKISMHRQEFRLRLSSEEDNSFLYKAVISLDIYQRFAHYNNLDVPFDEFSLYLHRLMHSVKNGQDYGESHHTPDAVDFVITQRPMGCVVQGRKLSLSFSIASDTELKDFVTQRFERLKQRCEEIEAALVSEKNKSRELEERNSYLQHSLEVSQTLIKSAETLQKHYESLLNHRNFAQHKGHELNAITQIESQNNSLEPHHQIYGFTESPMMSNDQSSPHLNFSIRLKSPEISLANCRQPAPLTPHDDPHFDDVMDFLNDNQLTPPAVQSKLDRSGSMLTVRKRSRASISYSDKFHVDPPNIEIDVDAAVHLLPLHGRTSPSAAAVSFSDSKKLKGAAKRKASFHNLTNNGCVSSHINSSVQQQIQNLTGNACVDRSTGSEQQSAVMSATHLTADYVKVDIENSDVGHSDAVKMVDGIAGGDMGRIGGSLLTSTTKVDDPGVVGDFRIDAGCGGIDCVEKTSSCGDGHPTLLAVGQRLQNPTQSPTSALLGVKLDGGSTAAEAQGGGLAVLTPLVNSSIAPTSAKASSFCVDAAKEAHQQSPQGQPPQVTHHHHHHHHVAFLESDAFRNYLAEGVGRNLTSAVSPLSPVTYTLNGNVLLDGLPSTAELLGDIDWGSMKMVENFDTTAAVKSGLTSPSNILPLMSSLADAGASSTAAPFTLELTTLSAPQSPGVNGDEDSAVELNASINPNCSSSSLDVGVLSYFKCLVCSQSFDAGSSHMAQHIRDSRTCGVCNDCSSFESKDELSKHMLTHSSRVYACQYCGKENPRVHYLKIHVRSHTGEKPYTCHQCGRGFADASTWRRHERVHTGEKPYQCNICGRKIARRDNVKIHMKSHMRAKHTASCKTCGKGFAQTSQLAVHERICCLPSVTDVGSKVSNSGVGSLQRTSPFVKSPLDVHLAVN